MFLLLVFDRQKAKLTRVTRRGASARRDENGQGSSGVNGTDSRSSIEESDYFSPSKRPRRQPQRKATAPAVKDSKTKPKESKTKPKESKVKPSAKQPAT